VTLDAVSTELPIIPDQFLTLALGVEGLSGVAGTYTGKDQDTDGQDLNPVPGPPMPAQAVITQNGSRLQIRYSRSGNFFDLFNATLIGDHFEGTGSPRPGRPPMRISLTFAGDTVTGTILTEPEQGPKSSFITFDLTRGS
jgi:hypothetical protein